MTSNNHHTYRRRADIIERPHRIAEGLWRVRGGPIRSMNVYLIEDADGLVAFDSGTRPMGFALSGLLGRRLRRIVLGHAHADHRGGARALGAPVVCHAAEVGRVQSVGAAGSFAPGKGGVRGLRGLPLPLAGWWMPRLMGHWDDGPVSVADTVQEGDQIANFEVVHLPGHTLGSIALWRERDRVALSSDAFYAFGRIVPKPGPPRIPTAHFNSDEQLVRASLGKLAALTPRVVWPGHFEPVTGDVAGALLAAAASDQ